MLCISVKLNKLKSNEGETTHQSTFIWLSFPLKLKPLSLVLMDRLPPVCLLPEGTPKVRAGAVDIVRYWQELGYLIIYITGRPDMQQVCHPFPTLYLIIN